MITFGPVSEPGSAWQGESGDGGSRTLVQTSSRTAFYTLILPLVFDPGLPEDGPALTYPLETWGGLEASVSCIRF